MRVLNKLLVFCIFILLVADCTQPFTPEISKYNNVLVIDGLVTNMPGPYEVRLSRSFPYDADTSEKVTRATVRVVDDLGNEYLFTEVERGVYRSDSSEFTGQIGRSYKLIISTSDGKQYESSQEYLKRPIEIDSVYYYYEPIAESDTKGVQIYLDTHDPENNTHYYGWVLEETWKIRVPFTPNGLHDKQTCYQSNVPKNIIIGSSIDNIQDEMLRFPVHYVSNHTNRLWLKYSLLVNQYTLTEVVYDYYKNLEKMNETSGSLFDPAPFSVTGNVKSVHNEEEPVLGIFQVSAVSSKRIFIVKSEFPPDFLPPTEYEYCQLRGVEVTDSLDDPYLQFRVDSIIWADGMVIMDTAMEGNTLYIRLASNRSCFDCTTAGTNIEPDFWE
jgi:hypothetical protein